MKFQTLLATTAVFAGTAVAIQAGDITGKITFKGAAPAEPGLAQKTAALKGDANCSKLSDAPKNRVFMVGAGGELGQVVVRLTGANIPAGAAKRTDDFVLDQKGCEYLPYISAVQAGQKFKVRNSDDALHNVHAVPKVAGNKETNKAQLAKGPDLDYTYDNPEDFLTFKCDVHPWMLAYVTVVSHPFFDVSAADGSFTIKNVPDGTYEVEAMHRRAGKQVKKVEVKGGKGSISFELEAPAAK
ncbi:MAG: hypothetical protein FJ405_18875 [Verrucomicrobia bacterium]|nr:hypothetical protein [Verrucomicrobiota bacterium]